MSEHEEVVQGLVEQSQETLAVLQRIQRGGTKDAHQTTWEMASTALVLALQTAQVVLSREAMEATK